MRYFVTGGTGFVGGELARQLVAAGHHVTALVRQLGKAEALRRLGVTLAEGDITRRDTLRAPMAGVDGVFHCAAWYKIGQPASGEAERINVEGTRNVLETMKELRIAKGVYTSTLAVFSDTDGRLVDETYVYSGPFLSEYDRTKWRAHYEVALPMIRAGLPLVIVMPGAVYGPGDTSALRALFVQFLQRKLLAVPAKTALCWAHVADVARGHVLAMERGRTGESYILAGPPHTLVDVVQMAERLTGIKGPSLRPSPAIMKGASGLVRALETVVTPPPELSSEGLRVMAGVTYIASNAKAGHELGYQPRPLEEGLRETLQHELERLGSA
jgi:nucleoside-diphosphate-sugar epimerase